MILSIGTEKTKAKAAKGATGEIKRINIGGTDQEDLTKEIIDLTEEGMIFILINTIIDIRQKVKVVGLLRQDQGHQTHLLLGIRGLKEKTSHEEIIRIILVQ